MKIRLYLLVCFISFHVVVHAQMKIGNNSTTINSASLLELETTNKGLVFPRVSLTDVASYSPLPAGLLTGTVVYNTNASVTNGSGIGIYFWSGSVWVPSIALTNLSATSPLVYNNTTGVFAINQSNTSANGYLSSTDWNTFNNKVGSISLTTPSAVFNTPVNFSVTSGAATGTLSLTTQTANTVFAGPTTGAAATPTFRILVAADIPSLAGSYIQNQTTQQASSNYNISGAGIVGGLLTSNGGHTNSGAFTSSGGIAGINASSNFATNINTGTSTGTVTIGNSLNNINLPKLSASSVVLTDASKNLTSSTPSSNSYLYYNGTNFTWQAASPVAWSTTGNASTTAGTNFIGTTDAIDFVTKTNNSERFRITSAGNVGINTSNPGSTLDVKGILRLSGSNSGYVALAPAADAGSTTYTLPAADGTAGQALITNGSGTLSWAIAAATIGTIGTGATIAGTATGKYYCTGSYITLPPGKYIVNVYMMLSSSPSTMNQTIPNQPGSFFIKSFFADASLGTVAGTTVSPPLPQTDVSADVVGNGKLISGSISVGQTYNPITGFVVINNTSGANKSYYYWAGWVSLTNVLSTNSLPLIGGTNYGEDNIVAYPTN
jgi:hypothetical protein